MHVRHHVDEGLVGVEAALQHDERRARLQALLGGVGEPDLGPLVQPAADDEPVHRGEPRHHDADRPHQEVLHADRRRRVRVVERADVRVGLDERDLLLEVERRLVPPAHDVRHDLLGRRQVAHEVAVGPFPPEHGAGSYSGPRYRHPVGFAELLAHPEVVEELELRSGVGFLALHGGLEPGTAEIARRRGRAGGELVLHGQPAPRAARARAVGRRRSRRSTAARRVPRPRPHRHLGPRLLPAARAAAVGARRRREPRARHHARGGAARRAARSTASSTTSTRSRRTCAASIPATR